MIKGPSNTSEIIVVGAGVVGLTTAYCLAKQGCQVTVIEQESDIRQQASWAGAGILSPLLPWRYPKIVQQLAAESQAQYAALIDEVNALTGHPVEYQALGMLIQDEAEIGPGLDWATANDQPAKVLDSSAIQQRFSNVNCDRLGIFLPAVFGLRNPDWLIALRKAISALGGTIFTDRNVKNIVVKQLVAKGVVCGNGQHLSADNIIIAAGAWSQQLLSPWLKLPIKPIRGQMLLYEAGALAPSTIVQQQGCYVIPRSDGRVLCGSTAEDVGFDVSTTEDARNKLSQAAEQMCHGLNQERLIRHWAGLRPALADELPVIGAVPGIAGLYVSTGHFRHGLTTSPASAQRLCAYLLQGGEIAEELNPNRFSVSTT